MEREILFRGKRIDDGEWVEGNLVKTQYNSYIVPIYDEFTFAPLFNAVFPETIGQFTGLTDKSGTKIFEGDIVRGRDYTYFIKFCNGAYYAFHCRVKDAEGEAYRWGLISRFEELNIEIEIIGNIHDNSELLK